MLFDAAADGVSGPSAVLADAVDSGLPRPDFAFPLGADSSSSFASISPRIPGGAGSLCHGRRLRLHGRSHGPAQRPRGRPGEWYVPAT